MRMHLQALLLCLILAGIIFRFAILNCCGFWHDEAIQFWISKGNSFWQMHNLGLQPLDTRLPALIVNTHRGLLGSPTFTFLIRYWSKISNSVFWLRIIPCLFGLGALPLIYLIARGCGFSKKWALAILAFSAWNGPWFYHSIELRAYSFEIFSSALTLLILIKILKAKYILISHCIWLALSILLGTTSGYGYHIYYPFILILSLFYIMIKDPDSKRQKFFKVLIIAAPVIISIFYLICNKTMCRLIIHRLIIRGTRPWYITYLCQYHGLTRFLKAIKMIISAISWQLFGVGEVAIQRLFDLPLGLPFIIISSLFLVCSIFILIRAIKRKNIIEGVVLAILLYSIAICTLLSGRGVAPIGPTRHNLFFSPALFISFFIWIRGAYQTLNRSHLRIKEGILSTFLLVFLLTPNIARDYVTVTDREDLRSLLRKIQPTVKESDNVYLYVDDMGIPALRYEYEYSNIPWLKALTYKDISNHLTFRAGIDSGYDYQWYIFRGVSEDFGRVDRAKANLKQEHDVIVDKEYLLPRARVASFRARRRITGHP